MLYKKKDNWRSYIYCFLYNVIRLFKIFVEFGGVKVVGWELIK